MLQISEQLNLVVSGPLFVGHQA